MKFYSHSYKSCKNIYIAVYNAQFIPLFKSIIHHTSDLTTYFIDDEHAK